MAKFLNSSPVQPSSRGGSFGLACNACNTEFSNENDQRNHYKSDWHRYNLNCQIAGLPIVTKALFLTRQTTLAKENNKFNEPSKQYTCGLCGKGFGSSEARAQHVNSHSHLTRVFQDACLNESKTIEKTLGACKPVLQNEGKHKLNAPSKLYTCGLCRKEFGSFEAHAQHLNSQSHITRVIQDRRLNESKTIVKTLAPHMVNKVSQNEEKNRLNAPSKLYNCGLCGKEFGSFEAHAQHLNSQSHKTRVIQDGHLKESKTIENTRAPHMVNKVSRNEEKNKLNAPSKLYNCGLGSSEAHAEHLNFHKTRVIQDGHHLNGSTTIVKTLAPHMVNKVSQNEEKNKLNVPSELYNCVLCGQVFRNSEAHAQHLNSLYHKTRVIQDDHRLNESTTIVKTLAPHMVSKLSQNEEKNKLNAPSYLNCDLCGLMFGSFETHTQHLNSQYHKTRLIQDGHHLNESTTIVKTLSPRIVAKLSQNEDGWEEVDVSDEWEEVDVSDEWDEVDVSDKWEEVDK